MFNLTISHDFLLYAVLVLCVFLLFFIPFFRDLLLSKKELRIRRLLEKDSRSLEEVAKVVKDFCKLPKEYFDSLHDPMISYCTKIFESPFSRENKIAWIEGINSVAGIKKREHRHASLVIRTREAISKISPDKLADPYFQYLMEINDSGYRRESKPEDYGVVEEFIFKNVLYSSYYNCRHEFLALLKNKMEQTLKDDKKIGNIQKTLVEAEILKIERSFSQA